ncbi:ribonucleoside triphosphate reductase, partial [Candidatus Bathyarchaeota archaeon]
MDKELQRSVEKIRHPRYIRKRDGRLEEFDQRRITIAISKAFNAVGEKDGEIHKRLSDEVVRQLYERYGEEGVPTVEEIQDLVEHTLMKNGFYEVSRAYILYREKRKELRELAFLLESGDMVDKYLQEMSWYVRENANLGYSMQGLNNYLVSKVISQYWLMRIYPPEIRRAHINGDFHIHNLGILGPYCVGWSLPDLLMEGFGGVANKLESKPPKHFSVALGQVVNFMYTLQGEAAGAQAFSNFDTYLAPYIREDRLTYREVLQTMQEFLFNMNVPTRVGGQTPFTNITLDLRVPRFMENEGVIIGGKIQDSVFGDFQEEMEIFNKAYLEVMLQGDAKGRIFSFPIPTYNVTEDFPWDYEPLWKLTAKFGAPYFSNFINSDMKPEDVRSMCCRLRIDNRELRKRGGSFFGANPLTGSIGVVTINMPRLGYLSKEEDEFFERLDHLMDLAMQSLEIKRKTVERFTEYGLYPFSRHYLRHIKEGFGSYWKNHFSTIGLLGMNEACLNFF